ncbi:MAG: M56/M15 family metallopeptidase [Pedobacter sp.]|nr:M56/M15 family metallopeptidase [Pedobacter sp.]
MEFVNYLLKVAACSALFFACYFLILRKLTFFKLNRFYLLITLILSCLIPAIDVTLERSIPPPPVDIETPLVEPTSLVNSDVLPTGQLLQAREMVAPFDWYALLPTAYMAVAGILLLVSCWKLFQLIRHVKNTKMSVNGLKLISKRDGFTNCSFFNYVFIDDETLSDEELHILLGHEQIHARQYHSIDKLIMVVAKAFLWFNPFVYWYEKALEQVHEYEADEATSRSCGTKSYASLLLKLAVSSSELHLVHNFVKSPVKERIKMLFAHKSRAMKKLSYLLILPIGLCLIWGFTIKYIDVSAAQENGFVLVLDAGHGGKATGAEVNGKTEKDLALAIAMKVKEQAEANGMKVLMTRSRDEAVSLASRLGTNGSLLLSFHVNTAVDRSKNGIEMYVAENKPSKTKKSILSGGLGYYLYGSLRSQRKIKVSSKPIPKHLLLLEQSTMPGVLLELGYLSNAADFKFITNEANQQALAKWIVAGVTRFKQSALDHNAIDRKIDSLVVSNKAKYGKLKSDTRLLDQAKSFKAQTLEGSIQSLHYTTRGAAQVLDGFILSANGKTYRIFLNKEMIGATSYKIGDRARLFAAKADVWADSDYPVLSPKSITLMNRSVTDGIVPVEMLRASAVSVDPKKDIAYITKGVFNLGKETLEAENITWDKKAGTLGAENATLKDHKGYLLKVGSIVYFLKTHTYQSKNPFMGYSPQESPAYEILTKLKKDNDTIKTRTMMDRTFMVMWKGELAVDKYQISGKVLRADIGSPYLVSYYGSLKTPSGEQYNAEVIEFDVVTKKIKTSTLYEYGR